MDVSLQQTRRHFTAKTSIQTCSEISFVLAPKTRTWIFMLNLLCLGYYRHLAASRVVGIVVMNPRMYFVHDNRQLNETATVGLVFLNT